MATRLMAVGSVLLLVLLTLYFTLGAPKAMTLPNTPLNLDFTCTQEVWPTPTPEAEQLFQAARTLERERNKANYPEIERLYREAIGLNHPKAMLNFQFLLNKGVVEPQKGLSASQEMIALNERLIAMNIPSAFYFMGYYVEYGIGVKSDFMDAMRFYRKAADLGNAEAQYFIGEFFIAKIWRDQKNQGHQPEIGEKMLACAANQGHSEAARTLGGYYKIHKQFELSRLFFQKAAKYGEIYGLLSLIDGFSITDPQDAFYLGQSQIDEERVRRYRLIKAELTRDEKAVFPDIDKIVPLPPAALPEWDGTFEYNKEFDAQMPRE